MGSTAAMISATRFKRPLLTALLICKLKTTKLELSLYFSTQFEEKLTKKKLNFTIQKGFTYSQDNWLV